jgi:hypothetical protein
MPQLRAVVVLVVLCMFLTPLPVEGAPPKTYLGVSGISFDYTPFW